MSDPATDEIEKPDLATAAAAARARDAAAAARPKRVGFAPRFAAGLLDGVCLIVLIAAHGVTSSYLDFAGRLTPATEYLLDVVAALLLVLYTSFEVFLAATPGKLVLGLRIAAADGAAADTWTLVNRWLYKNGNAMFALIYAVTTMPLAEWLGSLWGGVIALGCFFIFQDTRQAFHDRWARTAVYWKQTVQRRGFEPLPVGSPAPPW